MNAGTTRRALASLVPLVVLLSGCSEGREYAVPHKVCGVRMSQDTVEPLLPDGEKLDQSLRTIGEDGSVTSCLVSVVDKTVAVDVDITNLDKPLTADDKRVSVKSLKHAKSVHLAGTHWTVQGDNKIHLSTPCGLDGTDSLSFRFTFAKGEKGTEVTRRNTLRFAKAFVAGEQKGKGCPAH
ncbi:hypothetical protein [Streptomyces sp. RK75]|uniref:hypothetical protein n=1 Tax=Streptomyces sp. RK75 TaxID=2824895 RepID=UPI001B38D5D3|nr:hypothetical protein [Streptomyces sp. RK75]MBQ0863418.1 hypothetical protein [Streptomyces sp. RK75]